MTIFSHTFDKDLGLWTRKGRDFHHFRPQAVQLLSIAAFWGNRQKLITTIKGICNGSCRLVILPSLLFIDI